MGKSIIKDIVRSYENGELDALKPAILPFLITHKKQLRKFIENFEEQQGPMPLEFMVKYFILTYNIPFNLKFYLNKQSQIMTQDIGPDINAPDKRHDLVLTWIKEKAANYRSHSILTQIVCFDRMKDQLLPAIQKELETD